MAGIVERLANAVTQKAVSTATAAIPSSVQKHLPLARKLVSGDVDGLINSGLDALFERFGITGTNGLYGTTPLLGGLTLAEVRKQFEQCIAIEHAKANLFCLKISNLSGSLVAQDFNLFALDVSYSGANVAGNAVEIGCGSFDLVTNSNRHEMRVTTLDDSYGSLKRWFKDRHNRMCHKDGTFGLPPEYLFRVRVMHAFFSDEIQGASAAYSDTYLMRPGSIDYELSRREDQLQELQMTFVQWDTFAALT